MSDSNSPQSNLQSVEILGLIKGGAYTVAVEKILDAQDKRIEIVLEQELIARAFDEVIAWHKRENEHLKVIDLCLRKFKLVQINPSDRKVFLENLTKYLTDSKELMSKQDWSEIITLLQWQNNYLKLTGDAEEFAGQIELALGQFSYFKKSSKIINESEMKEFIEQTKTSFLKVIPDDESLDYAAQIIMHSKP